MGAAASSRCAGIERQEDQKAREVIRAKCEHVSSAEASHPVGLQCLFPSEDSWLEQLILGVDTQEQTVWHSVGIKIFYRLDLSFS